MWHLRRFDKFEKGVPGSVQLISWFSISYAEVEETHDYRSSTTTSDVTQESESLQIAYSMGSMSIKAYTTEITNPNFKEDADNLKRNEIALGLAF